MARLGHPGHVLLPGPVLQLGEPQGSELGALLAQPDLVDAAVLDVELLQDEVEEEPLRWQGLDDVVSDAEVQGGRETFLLLAVLDLLGLLLEVHVRGEATPAPQLVHELLGQPPVPGLVRAASEAGRLLLLCDRFCEEPGQIVRLDLVDVLFLHVFRAQKLRFKFNND